MPCIVLYNWVRVKGVTVFREDPGGNREEHFRCQIKRIYANSDVASTLITTTAIAILILAEDM
jgi:hypothetical protein